MTREDFDILVEKHYRERSEVLVAELSRRYGWHNAEDIVQDGYVRAIEYYASYNGGSFNAWFISILENAARKHMSKERRQGAVYKNPEENPCLQEVQKPNQDWAMSLKTIEDLIKRDFKSERGYSMMMDALLNQVGYEQLSEKYEVPEATIRGTVMRFRNKYKDMLLDMQE